jgi:fructose-1,6-bisphosphatase/inositol monophosphatase family enzyme
MGKKIDQPDIRHEIPTQDIAHFLDKALEYIIESRAIIRAALVKGFDVKRKPDKSFVTSVDLQVETRLRELIAKHFPDHGVIGEEFPATNPEAAFQWIMDPIDGTEDFVQRLPTFGTILALHYHGEPVVGIIDHPVLDIQLSAAFNRGTYHNGQRVTLTDIDPAAIDGSERVMLPARANFIKHRDDGRLFDKLTRAHPNHRIYRTCLTHSCAILGQADATVDYGNPVWDFASSRILIEEAGGKFTVVRTWSVPPLGWVHGSIFGKPALVDKLAAHFKKER